MRGSGSTQPTAILYGDLLKAEVASDPQAEAVNEGLMRRIFITDQNGERVELNPRDRETLIAVADARLREQHLNDVTVYIVADALPGNSDPLECSIRLSRLEDYGLLEREDAPRRARADSRYRLSDKGISAFRAITAED